MMMDSATVDFLKRLARAISVQFGPSCEVAVHDLSPEDTEHTIIAIENGHVTSRKAGDGPSHIVLEALKKAPDEIQDHLNYLTKTHDGRILKSSTIFIRDQERRPIGLFAINHDITGLLAASASLETLLNIEKQGSDNGDIEKIPQNVNELLDELIDQSVKRIGKPVALMSKDDKTSAIQFLNQTGAFLITKSGDKVAKHFGISKYTLYSYLGGN